MSSGRPGTCNERNVATLSEWEWDAMQLDRTRRSRPPSCSRRSAPRPGCGHDGRWCHEPLRVARPDVALRSRQDNLMVDGVDLVHRHRQTGVVALGVEQQVEPVCGDVALEVAD